MFQYFCKICISCWCFLALKSLKLCWNIMIFTEPWYRRIIQFMKVILAHCIHKSLGVNAGESHFLTCALFNFYSRQWRFTYIQKCSHLHLQSNPAELGFKSHTQGGILLLQFFQPQTKKIYVPHPFFMIALLTEYYAVPATTLA